MKKRSKDHWKIIYGISCIANYNTKVCIIKYELLNNAAHLNRKLCQFGIASCSKCFFYDIHDEVPLHLFYLHVQKTIKIIKNLITRLEI